MAYRVGFARLRTGCALYAVHVDSDIRLEADAKIGQHGEHGKRWVRLAIAALKTQPTVWAVGPQDPSWHRPYGNTSSSTQALVVHLDRFEQMMPLTPHRVGHHIEELLSIAAARIGYMQAFLPPAELGVFKKVTTLYDHNRRKAKALKAQHIRPMRNASAWRASIDASVCGSCRSSAFNVLVQVGKGSGSTVTQLFSKGDSVTGACSSVDRCDWACCRGVLPAGKSVRYVFDTRQ